MDDEEKEEGEGEEKSERAEFRTLVEQMRKQGHSDTEIVNVLLKLADEGKVEVEGEDEDDDDEDDKKVDGESQKKYDFHQDEKNYDEGKDAEKKSIMEALHHSF
jgi:hypothetical protein